MSGSKEGLIQLIFLLLCGACCVKCLTCYECTTWDGASCGDPLNKTAVGQVDCNWSIFTQGNLENEQFMCIVTKEQNSTDTIYTRRCALKSEGNICSQIKRENNGLDLTRCHLCEEDLCNSSVVIVSSALLFIVLTIISAAC